MAIERSKRPIAASRMAAMARKLLNASPLCAIATVASEGRAHVNTAYFAWSPQFDLVWLSEPRAKHSRNVRANDTAAVAVYDSSQVWGKPDRGIQLFGSAHEADGADVQDAEALYAKRFPDYRTSDLSAYRFYRFCPRRLKLFDERVLGTGVFVTASIAGEGRLAWERTEIYRQAV
ncbi:MAG TPA: pyridoxamine 5'-phosphate oxidase family protein [Gaiellaceae bacterium]|nr:pyridoxamine 5'-phosphate oxidase family protein [Gaiellaceae bacterium]